jgi:hypothetical protein
MVTLAHDIGVDPPDPSMTRRFLLLFLVLFLIPLAAHAVWWMSQDRADSWSRADWSSAGLLPSASARPQAMVHIYGARVGRWRGIFAHHTWIVLKEAGAPRYSRYDVVGWGSPLREDIRAPDGRWYGNPPELIAALEGEEAAALIPKLRAAIASYPHRDYGAYRAWPGPNSNTFVAHVLAQVPQWPVALPPTALGKDFRDDGFYAGLSPSRTGVQFSALGAASFMLGWVEGLEINLLGLVAGVDLRRPAVKLPGFGRIGLEAAPAAASVP